MNFWLIQSLNSLALGGVLFTLAAGFSLIFGLMRIANLSHGAYFMFGAYIGLTVLDRGHGFGEAVLAAGLVVGVMGGHDLERGSAACIATTTPNRPAAPSGR